MMSQRKLWMCRVIPVLAVLILCVTAVILPRQNTAVAADDPEMEIVDSYPYTTVTRTSVNLREKKSTGSALLKKIPSGATITVLSASGSWAQVEYGKYKGYVKSEYIVLKKVQKVKTTPTPTPAPTLSPAEDAGMYIVLRRGSSGSEVRALQEALIELGFLTGKADGEFGAATENAVIAFQRANNYPDTGLMDANIQAFLYVGTPKNAQGVATKIKTLSPVAGVAMKQGNKGEAVGKLQERLKELGYYTGSISCTYDAATKAAVVAFQKKNGLKKKDGIAGSETQEAIYSASALGPNSTPTPAPTPEPTPTPTPTPAPTYKVPDKTVQSGSEGTDAKTVQRRLKDLGYYTGKIDGEFGKASVDALKRFQEVNGLKADGKAGKTTYKILFSDKAKTAPTPTPVPEETEEPEASPTPGVDLTPTPTPAPSAITWEKLRNGSSGQAVSQLQEALIQLGYMSGKPDGKYGTGTEAAVKAFQKANGLTADGVAGAETQKKLYGGNAKAAKVKATATPTATPKATATPKPTATPASSNNKVAVSGTLREGDSGSDVKTLQQKLIQMGYLKDSADGIFGKKTAAAVTAFQKANNLKADGIVGSQTQAKLNSSSTSSTSTTQKSNPTGTVAGKPNASKVIYANWYTTVKAVCRNYPYVTIYDFQTGISWQGHIFSLGAHADYEPLTATDTSKMLKVFGSNTWNPRPVWVIFADGSVYMASTHSSPHGTQHVTDNNFAGHACIHFPRTQEQVTAIGPYATSHQEMIDKGWTATQAMK